MWYSFLVNKNKCKLFAQEWRYWNEEKSLKRNRGGERERFLGHIHKNRLEKFGPQKFHFFGDLSYVFDNDFQSFQFLVEKENRFSCNNIFALTSLNVNYFTK